MIHDLIDILYPDCDIPPEQLTNPHVPGYHFFASSAGNWATGSDLLETMTRLQKEDARDSRLWVLRASVYLVPLPEDATYEIRNGLPHVPGVVFLASYAYPQAVKKYEAHQRKLAKNKSALAAA